MKPTSRQSRQYKPIQGTDYRGYWTVEPGERSVPMKKSFPMKKALGCLYRALISLALTAGVAEGALFFLGEKPMAYFYEGGVALGIASKNVKSNYFETFPPILDRSIDYTESSEVNYDTGVLRHFSGYYLNWPNNAPIAKNGKRR